MACGAHMDTTLDELEETRYRKRNLGVIMKMTKETHFNKCEVEALAIIYYKIYRQRDPKAKGVTKTHLLEFLHNSLDMTGTEMASNVITVYCRAIERTISLENFLRFMSVILKGTVEEQLKHCFTVYDMMLSGKISRDIMLNLLGHALIVRANEEDPEDAVKDLIDLIVKKMDYDRDGKISMEDYRKTCMHEPFLLEFLGQCLPSRHCANAFLHTLTHTPGKI